MIWNKDEVQQNLDAMLEAYKGRVYTPESIKSAKEDRAKVNGWDKQLGAAATAAKKLYMKPLEDFQQSIKEMQGKCKEISGAIDAQVKAVEAAEKEEKASTLRLIYRDNIGELEPLIPFERLLDSHWLNKTFAVAEAKKSLCQSIENMLRRCRRWLPRSPAHRPARSIISGSSSSRKTSNGFVKLPRNAGSISAASNNLQHSRR